MTAQSIITKARYTLGDIEKPYKWSDERLLGLLSEGQNDLVIFAKASYEDAYIILGNNVSEYNLHSNLAKLIRIENLYGPIDIRTISDLDKRNKQWRLSEGRETVAVVKDYLPINKLVVYPKPSELSSKTYRLTIDGRNVYVISFQDDLTVFTGTWHSSVDMTDAPIESYEEVAPEDVVWGMVSDIMVEGESGYDTIEALTSMGFVTGYQGMITIENEKASMVSSLAKESYGVLHYNYLSLVDEIESVSDELLFSDLWATALKYYVLSQALMDDNDENNFAKGVSFFSRYERERTARFALAAQANADEDMTTDYIYTGGEQNHNNGDY